MTRKEKYLPEPEDLICSRCGYLPDEEELVEQGCPYCGSPLEEIGEIRPCRSHIHLRIPKAISKGDCVGGAERAKAEARAQTFLGGPINPHDWRSKRDNAWSVSCLADLILSVQEEAKRVVRSAAIKTVSVDQYETACRMRDEILRRLELC